MGIYLHALLNNSFNVKNDKSSSTKPFSINDLSMGSSPEISP